MGFMGVRICTKEGKGFCLIGIWYITYEVQNNTIQYSTVQCSSNIIVSEEKFERIEPFVSLGYGT